MARTNLRAAFMSGVDSPISAQQVFTNRADEIAAFEQAIRTHRHALEDQAVSPVDDRSQGRRNVLAFYGVGGIGKTTLSLELERRLLAGEVAGASEDAVAIRMDLAEPGAADIETVLLRLRAGLGRLGRRWTAFDLAITAYWARAHQGERLQEFLDASPLVRRAAKRVGLGEQIDENVNLVAPVELGGLPGLAQKAALNIYRVLRERVREGRVMADCDLFAELIDAEADHETLSYFGYLLAWDLQRIRREAPTVCVFLDTFEALAGHHDQTAERLLQRTIYLMPNALFVLTGRNRIGWADRAAVGELDFTGPERWPHLCSANHTNEPHQHLVGYLSDADADRYLRDALRRSDEPALPPSVRQRIIAGGEGLPLYLDLSVSHCAELLARGAAPTPDDFGGSFTAVATRSIRDLPRDERDLVRTAALVDRFDADLLRAGQPHINDGTLGRFLRRPFLIHDDAYELPYTLHRALRTAIEEADQGLSDGWSDSDRRAVADRLLAGLGRRVDHDTTRSAVAAAVEVGIELATTRGVFNDWLPQAVQHLADVGDWNTLASRTRRPHDESDHAEIAALRAAAEGIVLRRSGEPAHAVQVLEEAGTGLADDSVTGQLVRLHLAHALRNTGEYGRAAEILGGLTDGPFAGTARYWLCDHDFLNGRFGPALEQLDRMDSRSIAEEGERLRLVGHIQRVNARFEVARSTYEQAVRIAQQHGLAAAEAKALTNIAQTACWSGDRATVESTAAQARALLDLVPNAVERVKLRAAEAAALAVAGDAAGADQAVRDTRGLADDIGYRGGHNLADIAAILVAVRSGDDTDAERLLSALEDRTLASGGNTYWVPIARSWMTGPEEAEAAGDSAIDWLDGAGETLRRWAAVADR